jgi:hypothetical protein
MPALANVVLTNTFDEWRTRTNQIIVKLDQIESANVRLQSNSSVIQIGNPDGKLGNTIYVTSNAVSNTGGSITGSLSISANTSTANLSVTTAANIMGRLEITGNVTYYGASSILNLL